MKLGAVRTPSGPRLAVLSEGRALTGGRLPARLRDAFAIRIGELRDLVESAGDLQDAGAALAAPIDEGQEVWAGGVTYERSREARVAESRGLTVYDLVYEADRPELFFKALPHRVAGPGEEIAIRADSTWNVPEPELAVAINAFGEVVGYTLGNDVSSRSIEGENPLYLPQAKVYEGSCALGPAIVPAWEIPDPRDLTLELRIERAGEVAFAGSIAASAMRRTVPDLLGWLLRGLSFPYGAFLLTGTGVVPPDDFTLHPGDVVTVACEAIGELVNPVRELPPQGPAP